MIVAADASMVLGWVLIAAGLISLAIAAVEWKALIEAFREVARSRAGPPLIIGVVAIVAGTIVLHWF
jgi:uncharacterized membrane protein YidH (DUF202 family)